MKILLDTHAFLWFLQDSSQLSRTAKEMILDPAQELFLSAASYWEMCLALSIGRLDLAAGWERAFDDEMEVNGIAWLPIGREHIRGILSLPMHHRDPFDRLIVSQAMIEGAAIATPDSTFRAYDVQVIW